MTLGNVSAPPSSVPYMTSACCWAHDLALRVGSAHIGSARIDPDHIDLDHTVGGHHYFVGRLDKLHNLFA